MQSRQSSQSGLSWHASSSALHEPIALISRLTHWLHASGLDPPAPEDEPLLLEVVPLAELDASAELDPPLAAVVLDDPPLPVGAPPAPVVSEVLPPLPLDVLPPFPALVSWPSSSPPSASSTMQPAVSTARVNPSIIEVLRIFASIAATHRKAQTSAGTRHELVRTVAEAGFQVVFCLLPGAPRAHVAASSPQPAASASQITGPAKVR
jgi:hypothetical protein